MGGESTEAWRAVLDDLIRRDLRRPQCLIVDGAPGIENAIAAVWGGVPVQRSSSSAGSRRRPCCHRQTPLPCSPYANRQSDSLTSLKIAPRNYNHIPGGTDYRHAHQTPTMTRGIRAFTATAHKILTLRIAGFVWPTKWK
jgi:hypothetical protein